MRYWLSAKAIYGNGNPDARSSSTKRAHQLELEYRELVSIDPDMLPRVNILCAPGKDG
jgi:hypothetical protein